MNAWLRVFPGLLLEILANFGSRVYSGIVSVVCAPLLIRFLGFDTYGLLGIFSTLQAFALLLDLGFSATLTRELARRPTVKRDGWAERVLVRTFELPFWCLSLAVGVAIWLIAPIFVHSWVHSDKLGDDDLVCAVRLMGLIIAFQLPAGFYSGALVGLGRLGLLSALNVAGTTFKNFGVLAFLSVNSPSSERFFLWQVFSAIGLVFLLRRATFRSLPAGPEARFDVAVLKRTYRFALGMSRITLLSIVTQNADKIILARVLQLGEFGRYSFYFTLASVITMLASALYMSVFPRIAALIESQENVALDKFFKDASDVLVFMVVPVSAVMIVMPGQCLLGAMGRPDTTEGNHLFVLVSVAMLLNAFAWLPYALLIGAGQTRAVFRLYVLGACIIIPALIVAAIQNGTEGAAIVWIAFQGLNSCGMTFVAASQGWLRNVLKWLFLRAVVPFTITILGVGGLAFFLFPPAHGRMEAISYLVTGGLAGLVLTGGLLLGARYWRLPSPERDIAAEVSRDKPYALGKSVL